MNGLRCMAWLVTSALGCGCVVPPPIPLPPAPPPVPATVLARLSDPPHIELPPETASGAAEPLLVSFRPGRGPLRLEEVLEAVETRFPLLLAAEEQIGIAEGQLLAAEGAFDTNLVSRSKLQPLGYYENYRADTFLKRSTRLFGAEVLGGYRIGRGDFATYDKEEETNDAGEVRLEVLVPLLRDSTIDQRRAREWRARIAREGADPEIQAKRLKFARDAAQAYWKWVAAGRKRTIAQTLLSLAETRRAQLEEATAEGLLPEIVVTDNQRLVAERRAILYAAERELERTSLALGLYYRTADGTIDPPDDSRLPSGFPEAPAPDPSVVEADVALARELRPEMRSLRLQLAGLEVEERLARNGMLPSLGVKLGGSQDLGGSSSSLEDKDDFELEAAVEFSVPLGRRTPRGKLIAVRAKIRQIDRKIGFTEDKVQTEVRDAASAMRQAYLRIGAARESLELARTMEEAEQALLIEGDSDLLRVNLREQQTARAASFLVDVTDEYYRARADYRAAVGVVDSVTSSI